jgi:uncharacterized membrane protein
MRIVSTTSRRFHPGPHVQRGAIGLWGSLTLLLAVMFMALAVDTGRLWMQQRKLQSIADIAAMEAAREIVGCGIDASDAIRIKAQAAAARNGYSGQLAQSPNVVELGSATTVDGIRQFTSSLEQRAVRVYITESVPASLIAGGLFGNQVLLNAEAVSAADPALVTFTAGSFLLDIDTENAELMNELLGELLDTSLSLSVLSYEGLATADLTLANLLRVYGSASTVNELLEAEMALGDLLTLIADGVADAGTAEGLAAAALQELSSGVGNNATIRLSDILAVSAPNEDATAELSLNAFSLIMAAAMFANEESTVTISIAGLEAEITIHQAPLHAVGPSEGDSCTVARTAQLDVRVTASIAGALDVTLTAEVAQGSAELTEFSDDGSEARVVIAATPGIIEVNGSATLVVDPPLLPPTSVPVAIHVPLNPATTQDLEFEVAHPTAENLPQTETTGSSLGNSLENALQQEDILTLPPALNPLLEPLVDIAINTLLSPLLGEIGRVLLDPLLEMLGIRLGGMDVTLHSIQLRQEKPLII